MWHRLCHCWDAAWGAIRQMLFEEGKVRLTSVVPQSALQVATTQVWPWSYLVPLMEHKILKHVPNAMQVRHWPSNLYLAVTVRKRMA